MKKGLFACKNMQCEKEENTAYSEKQIKKKICFWSAKCGLCCGFNIS